jgi:hypothetical protein
MNQLSAQFHEKYDPLVQADPGFTRRSDYLEALLYNLLVQTSCFRYWARVLGQIMLALCTNEAAALTR